MASTGDTHMLLVAGSALIAFESVYKLTHLSAVNAEIIMGVAFAGILINGSTALLFMRNSEKDLNIRGAFLHLAGDALILSKASCKTCESITGKFERTLLRTILGPFRIKIGAPTRRPNERPDTLEMQLARVDRPGDSPIVIPSCATNLLIDGVTFSCIAPSKRIRGCARHSRYSQYGVAPTNGLSLTRSATSVASMTAERTSSRSIGRSRSSASM